MISDAQKEVLNDLLLTEQVSDILQTMTTLAHAESRRLSGEVTRMQQSDLPGMNPLLFKAATLAASAAVVRVSVIAAATQEATAKERKFGTAPYHYNTQPVQQALL